MNCNLIKCIHCGNEMPENQSVCLNCGCCPVDAFHININRKQSFVGCLVPFIINISNNSINECISIDNGCNTSIKLPVGDYNFKLSLGTNKSEFNISINKNSTFEVGILAAKSFFSFTNNLYIKELN